VKKGDVIHAPDVDRHVMMKIEHEDLELVSCVIISVGLEASYYDIWNPGRSSQLRNITVMTPSSKLRNFYCKEIELFKRIHVECMACKTTATKV